MRTLLGLVVLCCLCVPVQAQQTDDGAKVKVYLPSHPAMNPYTPSTGLIVFRRPALPIAPVVVIPRPVIAVPSVVLPTVLPAAVPGMAWVRIGLFRWALVPVK